MTAALDLGSSEFRSLRRVDKRLVARRLPAVYTVLDDQETHRRLLEQSQIPFSRASGSLLVIGESAIELSALLSRPLVPLLQGGQLGDQDPIGRQVCAWMIDLLLPLSKQGNELCLLTLPRGETDTSGNNRTCQFLENVIDLQGYQTKTMHPATALAIAELEDHEYTGICMTFGAESVTFSLTHHSQPIIESCHRNGMNEIIERYAHLHKKYLWDGNGNSYLDLAGIRHWLCSGDVSLVKPESAEECWLRSSLEELLLRTWFGLKHKISQCHASIHRQSLPIVISGAVTQLTGFTTLALETLKLSGLPIQVSEIQTATFEPYSVARGLLIQAALLNSASPSGVSAA